MSEDLTPRQPSLEERIEQLFALVNQLVTDVQEIKTELSARKRDKKPMIEQIHAKVAGIDHMVQEIKEDTGNFRYEVRAEFRDIKRAYLKIEEWIDQTEREKSKNVG